jgi:threonine dehydratase
VESGLDRSDGRPQSGRDLGHGAFVEVVHHQDGSIVERKPGEGPIEDVGVGRPVVEGSAGGCLLAPVLGVEEADLANLRSTAPAELPPAGVQVDPAEPGVECVRVAERLAVAPGRYERLLHGVGCVGGVSKDRERGAVHGIDPVAEEAIEGIAVAHSGSLDELSLHLPPSLPLPLTMLGGRSRLHRLSVDPPPADQMPRAAARASASRHTSAMPDHIVPLERFHDARRLLDGRIHRTPILSSSTAGRVLAARGIRIGDGRVYAKAEHLQKTGAFKIRGALNKLGALTDAERAAGVITLSAGNHAQGVALAAREAGVHAVVMMPAGAVRSKVDACLGYGAEVILFGQDVGETWTRMEEVEAERGLTFVPPFDDPWIIAGQGTVGLEILEDLPDVDVVVAGIGGGALCSGTAAAIKETRPGVRVYGVEPATSNSMSLAVERGEIVRIQPVSVADGLGAPFAGEWTLAMTKRYVDGIALLDDATILAGMRFALERMKQLVEPAGAAALAAVLFGHVPIHDGERVCVIFSGGNVDPARLGELLAGAAPLEVPAAV